MPLLNQYAIISVSNNSTTVFNKNIDKVLNITGDDSVSPEQPARQVYFMSSHPFLAAVTKYPTEHH